MRTCHPTNAHSYRSFSQHDAQVASLRREQQEAASKIQALMRGKAGRAKAAGLQLQRLRAEEQAAAARILALQQQQQAREAAAAKAAAAEAVEAAAAEQAELQQRRRERRRAKGKDSPVATKQRKKKEKKERKKKKRSPTSSLEEAMMNLKPWEDSPIRADSSIDISELSHSGGLGQALMALNTPKPRARPATSRPMRHMQHRSNSARRPNSADIRLGARDDLQEFHSRFPSDGARHESLEGALRAMSGGSPDAATGSRATRIAPAPAGTNLSQLQLALSGLDKLEKPQKPRRGGSHRKGSPGGLSLPPVRGKGGLPPVKGATPTSRGCVHHAAGAPCHARNALQPGAPCGCLLRSPVAACFMELRASRAAPPARPTPHPAARAATCCFPAAPPGATQP